MSSLCECVPVDMYNVSGVNTCFSIRHVIFLTLLCGCSILFTKGIINTRLKLLLGQIEESRHCYRNVICLLHFIHILHET
jgi:hypothetical protein